MIKVSLSETEIKSLLDKYPKPSNCLFIDPPKLNNGITRDENIISRDERIENNQFKAAAALAAYQQGISLLIDQEKYFDEIGKLVYHENPGYDYIY